MDERMHRNVVRVANSLRRADITSVDRVRMMSESELRAVRNLGVGSVALIGEILSDTTSPGFKVFQDRLALTIPTLTPSPERQLTDQQLAVLALRYGQEKPATYAFIGQQLGGISRERARQLHADAFRRIYRYHRRSLRGEPLPGRARDALDQYGLAVLQELERS